MSRPRAFTLIELLFTVAVIAILAGIAVPNFLEAQVRSKLARVRYDMRTLEAALRAYGARHEAYPPNRPDYARRLAEIRDAGPHAQPPEPRHDTMTDAGPEMEFMLDSGWDLAPLTTPLSWVSINLPTDIFGNCPVKHPHGVEYERPPFAYVNLAALLTEEEATSHGLPAQPYYILSHGPDERLNLANPLFGPFIVYDPTNGATSRGDLLIFGR